ncbi:MAG: universal stress protein [Deltaproteobacteria bacterium]|jgi:nucleotide-binding universal stress UspA family protein|nr:universal stress protein [Deltaproteobacteria bacterium]
MLRLPAIVCATDLSEGSNKALHLAAFIAEKTRAKLVVAHVVDLPAVTPYGETMVDPQELQARVSQSAKAQIGDILTELPPDRWELKVSIGYPAREICEIVKQTDARLLIAATHIRSGFERLLLGSVTRKLMITIPVPFLTVSGSLPIERLSLHSIESILVSTDFSDESLEAVRWGFNFARVFGARVTLATVIESTQLDQILALDPQKEKAAAQKYTDELKRRLTEMVPGDLSERADIRVLAGKPHEELNKYAILNHNDLICVGFRGRGFVEAIMVGSTTDRLVRIGQFPILAVRAGLERDWEDDGAPDPAAAGGGI